MRPVFAIAIGIQLALLGGLLAWPWLFNQAPSIREIALSLPDPLLEAQHAEASKALESESNRLAARKWAMSQSRSVSMASSELKVRQTLVEIAADRKAPMKKRKEALDHALKIVDDRHYYELDDLWADLSLETPLREQMFDDLLGRPFDQILLTCLDVAQEGRDPLQDRAAKLLKVYTQKDKVVSYEDSNQPKTLPLN